MIKLTRDMLTFSAPAEATSILNKLREFLIERNIDCYVVGGFVRDGLIGRINTDIDVAVAGDATSIASEVAEAFDARMVPLDEVNQVARVVLIKIQGHWHLDFATLRGSIEEDLGNRDFTINAIAINLAESKEGWSQVKVIDPLGGCHDLSRKLVRAVSEGSFRQDPARLIRAVRLAAMLNFSVDTDTEALVQRDCKLLSKVSPERLRDELCCILETARAYRALQQLDHVGLLEAFMPELTATKGATQPKEHYWDVFDHSLETVAAVERLLREKNEDRVDDILAPVPWSSEMAQYFDQEVAGGRTRRVLLKMAALLHDIAKPATKTTEQDGRMRFLGHAKQGAEIAVRLMERLRFSKREIKMVQLMIEQHLRPGYLVREEMPSNRAIYKYFRDTADVGIDTLYLGLADHLAARGPMLDLAQWRAHADTTQYILSKWFQEQKAVVPPKLIDGHTLIDKLGLTPGPQIGELLEMVREAQAAGEIHTAEEAFDLVKKRLGNNS
ncbi:MAG TPA: HD domain-containing protein [Dehalococcoidia bacterium]|nr:HD domain-containing protein [Dehalococcoidia bacterium]